MNKLAPVSALLAIFLLSLFTVSCDRKLCCPHPGQQFSHTLAPGHSARDFLSADKFTDLVVEIDYMTGYKPNANALNTLEQFFSQWLHKAEIVILEPTEIQGKDEDTYSAEEIRNLEIEFRDTFTEEPSLSAYILIVDGKYAQENVLGIAYYNTSVAFFGAAFDQASGGLTQVSRYEIETTSFRHEFGHLFGLVAIDGSGTEMQEPHKEHGNHCDNDQCLMYYAVESTELFGSVFGGDIPQLDQNCINDLQANGGK